MKIFLATLLALVASSCYAQTTSPVITEDNVKVGKVYKGEVTFTSSSLAALSVTVEPVSFTVNKDGSTSFRKLDSSIHITLSENSALVGISQRHEFDFKASCDTYPCAFTLYSSSIIGHTKEGVAVKTALPSTFYLCAKGSPEAKHCRDATKAAMMNAPSSTLAKN